MIELPGCEAIAAYKDLTEEDWLELRKSGIGGSDAAAVMMDSKYNSPFSVCMEKTGRADREDLSDNEFVKVGNILEPLIRDNVVCDYLKDEQGIDAKAINPEHTYRSKEHPFMLMNPDGFLYLFGLEKHAGLEIKTGSSYTLKNWGGVDGDDVPIQYYWQCQHYLAVSGLDEWFLFGLIGNQRVLRIIERNEEDIQRLIEAERELWEIIEQNDPLRFPLPIGLDSEMDILMQYGNPQNEETMDLSDSLHIIQEYQGMKNAEKAIHNGAEGLKAEIIFKLGNHKYGETPKHKVTFSRFETKRFDRKKFTKEHPTLAQEYITTSESGRLYVREI
jgi:putative phage-type endonuclease